MGNPRSADVLIVGGGPAGLATALALRRLGASVMVADARIPPIDKACGEGLMPDSLACLVGLGVELGPGDGAALRGIQFVNYRGGVEADVAIACFPALSAGLGVRRRTLHARMVESAEAAGVDLRWGSAVQLRGGIWNGEVLVHGETIHYGWLVGADGLSSRVRVWAGLELNTVASRRFGFRRHFAVEPWSDSVEVHWGLSGQAYVTPVSAKEICVAGVVRDPHCRLEMLLREMPSLEARLGGVGSLDRERGSVTVTQRLRRVARGRVALVGDASGSADAITGEGLGLSFRQALLLAECLDGGGSDQLTRYDRRHPEILKLAQTMARGMLLMDGSKIFRDRAIGMLAERPKIFERLLGVHLGTESIGRFLAAKGFEVAWRLLVGSHLSRAEKGLPALSAISCSSTAGVPGAAGDFS